MLCKGMNGGSARCVVDGAGRSGGGGWCRSQVEQAWLVVEHMAAGEESPDRKEHRVTELLVAKWADQSTTLTAN